MGTFLLDESSYYTGNSTGDNPEGCIVSSVVSSFGLTPVYSAVELSVESPDLASPCAIIVTGGASTGISSMDEPDAIIEVFFQKRSSLLRDGKASRTSICPPSQKEESFEQPSFGCGIS